MVTFSWLHLTDLHRGKTTDEHLWPTTKAAFFEDLEKLHEKSGPWDMILFTGDLTQSGRQFDEVDAILKEIEGKIHALGSTNVKFLAVPGNHDLIRPDKNDPYVILMKEWNQQRRVQVRSEFWTKKQSGYRQIVADAFGNYSNWWGNRISKFQNLIQGMLPGDFSFWFEKEGYQLGLIGLNTAFLQLTEGNYKEKLALDVRQFNAVCDGNLPGWTSDRTICLLLTHHPSTWLNKESQEYLSSEIRIQKRFLLHLCGHMHETAFTQISEAAEIPHRVWQGRSLFSLENYGQKCIRSHGYAVGRIEIDKTNNSLRLIIWPRTRSKRGELIPDNDPIALIDEHIQPIYTPITPSKRDEVRVPPSKEVQPIPPSQNEQDKTERISNRERWLNIHKFKYDPFVHVDGARDPDLIEYFFPILGYDNIIKSLAVPNTRFVFGAEGSGKSSFRNALAQECRAKNYLSVVYEDFRPLLDDASMGNTVSVKQHIGQILKAAIRAIKELKPSISMQKSAGIDDYLEFLGAYIDKFPPDLLTSLTLKKKLRLKEKSDIKLADDDLPNLLNVFCDCIKAVFGYNGIYFLIDPVQTLHNDITVSWQSLEPLLSSQVLLTMEGYRDIAFFFFLNTAFKDRVLNIKWIGEKQMARVIDLEWSNEKLHELLKWRIKHCNYRKPPYDRLSQICEELDLDVDDTVIELANQSPRQLIAICNRIFDVHCQTITEDNLMITRDEITEALKPFRKIDQIEQLVRNGESSQLEFKSTLRFNLHLQKRDPAMELAVAKTLCAFTNSEGGTLLIGIDDMGDAVGLDADIHTLRKKSLDGFQLSFYDVVDQYLGKIARDYIEISFPEYQGKTIGVVEISKSLKPVYCDGEIYVRLGNSSRVLNTQEAMNYIQQHWPESNAVGQEESH